MSILSAQTAIAGMIAELPGIADDGIAPVAEDALDVETRIQQAMESLGVAVMVLTPEASNAGEAEDGAIAMSLPRVIVAVTETPAVNRERGGARTALDIAEAIARGLHGGGSGLAFDSLRQRADGDTIIVEVVFKCIYVTDN